MEKEKSTEKIEKLTRLYPGKLTGKELRYLQKVKGWTFLSYDCIGGDMAVNVMSPDRWSVIVLDDNGKRL